jgi:hypothetical protein
VVERREPVPPHGGATANIVRGDVSFENIDISSHHSDGSGYILDQNSDGAATPILSRACAARERLALTPAPLSQGGEGGEAQYPAR